MATYNIIHPTHPTHAPTDIMMDSHQLLETEQEFSAGTFRMLLGNNRNGMTDDHNCNNTIQLCSPAASAHLICGYDADKISGEACL